MDNDLLINFTGTRHESTHGRVVITRALEMTGKDFRLGGVHAGPGTRPRGRCLASEMMRGEGPQVGFMYREKPRDPSDSGWCFLTGRESREYMVDPANHAVSDVEVIAREDPEIIPLLDSPVGSVFRRDRASGRFVVVGFAPPED